MATATEQAPELFCQIDQLRSALEGQIVVSQNRWVDHCLDLLNRLDQLPLRQIVKRVLAEISHLSSVDARWLSEQLRLLETAADADGTVRPFRGETDLFVVPGHSFRTAEVLLTNFHLPRSTLFMLVCAFSGTARMRAAYEHAKEAGYRFYSYGDCCLLLRPAT